MSELNNLQYSSPSEFISWVGSNYAGVLSNDIPFDLSPENALISKSLYFAEAEVDSYVGKVLKLPISQTNLKVKYLLEMFVYDIATCKLYSRNGLTKEIHYKYESVLKKLKQIANQEIIIDFENTGAIQLLASGSIFERVFYDKVNI
jgi:phage gp36-like protein